MLAWFSEEYSYDLERVSVWEDHRDVSIEAYTSMSSAR